MRPRGHGSDLLPLRWRKQGACKPLGKTGNYPLFCPPNLKSRVPVGTDKSYPPRIKSYQTQGDWDCAWAPCVSQITDGGSQERGPGRSQGPMCWKELGTAGLGGWRGRLPAQCPHPSSEPPGKRGGPCRACPAAPWIRSGEVRSSAPGSGPLTSVEPRTGDRTPVPTATLGAAPTLSRVGLGAGGHNPRL